MPWPPQLWLWGTPHQALHSCRTGKHAVVVGERGIGRSIEWIAVQGLLEILPGFPEVLKTALAPVIAATEIGIVRIGVHGTRFLQTRFSSWAVSLTRISPATDRATWL